MVAGKVVPVIFTLDELWLLQGVVRHESQDQSRWQHPATSLEFNRLIAEAIVNCADDGFSDVALPMTAHFLMLVDYVVPQAAKDTSGLPIGKNILMKSFRAWKAMHDETPTADADTECGPEMRESLKTFNSGQAGDVA